LGIKERNCPAASLHTLRKVHWPFGYVVIAGENDDRVVWHATLLFCRRIEED
jgi:hypothetical protein